MDEPGGVLPDTARQYTKTVADLYAEAAVQILRLVAQKVADGADAGPVRVKAVDLLLLRREAQRIANRVTGATDRELSDVLRAGYAHGVQSAADDLADALGYRNAAVERTALDQLTATNAGTVHGLAKGLSKVLRALPIVRATEDAYRAAVAGTIAPAAAGVETRRQAAQRALDRLAMQGIGGFTDSAGRRWRLASYVEMATRATLAQAATEGAVDRIRRTTPFVQVSDQADECERCRPWEGKVLVVDTIPDEFAHVDYDGTLADARSGGLFHPGCTHALSAFVPGLTRRREGRANPQGAADRAEQRRLERGLRAWKERRAVAVTPAAEALADRKVAEWSQKIAEHTARTDRLRVRSREQVVRAR